MYTPMDSILLKNTCLKVGLNVDFKMNSFVFVCVCISVNQATVFCKQKLAKCYHITLWP